MKIKLILLTLCLLTACNFPKATPAVPATEPPATNIAPSLTDALQATDITPSPSDALPAFNLVAKYPAVKLVVRASNSGPASSDTFTIPEKGMYRVNWQQASTGKFLLAVINTDAAQVGTPNGRVIFESVTGSSAFLSDYVFAAGDYKVTVEQADGPWSVWVEYVGPASQ